MEKQTAEVIEKKEKEIELFRENMEKCKNDWEAVKKEMELLQIEREKEKEEYEALNIANAQSLQEVKIQHKKEIDESNETAIGLTLKLAD